MPFFTINIIYPFVPQTVFVWLNSIHSLCSSRHLFLLTFVLFLQTLPPTRKSFQCVTQPSNTFGVLPSLVRSQNVTTLQPPLVVHGNRILTGPGAEETWV